MSTRLAYGLSALVLALSLAALACDLGAFLLHFTFSPKLKRALDIAAFIWPLPAVFFGTYQRKLHAAAQDRNPAA
jgi:hypothetical protein